MDRRGLRANVMLVAVAMVASVPLATRVLDERPTSAISAHGPDASMAGPTTSAAIGPTAISGSRVWDGLVTVSGRPQGLAPNVSSKPAWVPRPTLVPVPDPAPRPTAKPAWKPPSCQVFPADNAWNQRVDGLPVAANSTTMIAAIGAGGALHPDFSSLAWNGGKGYGIPFNKVDSSTPTSSVSFQWADESDPGPYPIPASPKIESGSDAHLLLWDTQGCQLFEIFAAYKSNGQWYGSSGAIWNLRSNALRPNGWTSADAAGLPILPGLARWEEVAAGAILHALRFTAPDTCSGHVWPARHDAGSGSCAVNPPMGLRVRLKAGVDISGFGPQARIILTALKRYGMLLADNGSPWYITGAPNASWDDDDLHDLNQLQGSDFEVVDTSSMH